MRWILLSAVVVTTVLADLLQSYEMRTTAESGAAPGLSRVLLLIVKRRFLTLAILCMAISFFAFLALVQTEPISFAVPASAASFVLETILAKLVLKEQIARRRTAGALLVLAGILLVART